MTRHRLAMWTMGVLTLALLTFGVPPGAAEEAAGSYTAEQIMEKYGPAVVFIRGKTREGGALGSGFLISADGQIVTNYHVVRGLYPAQVKLANGDVYDDISVIKYDARRDLAVLKINGFGLPAVELGDSDEVKPGERVVVIGSPEGFKNTVSDGLFSGAREMPAGYKVYQMSAPISEGSSGGPVFDSQGRVIGVTVAFWGEGQNLNFCIPINYARGLIGGPVKYGLKDLPYEKLGTEAADSAGGSSAETLKVLIEAVTTYYRALEYATQGVEDSAMAEVWDRQRGEDAWPAKIDALFSDSLALFDQAEEQAVRAASGGGAAAALARRVAVSIAKVGDAYDGIAETYISPPLSYGAVLQNCCAVSRTGQIEFEKEMEELQEIVADAAPELTSTLPSRFDPDRQPKPGDGFIEGLLWSRVGEEAHVVYVSPKTPAARAGFKAGDVVLGVEGGPSFANRAEAEQYLRARPNQTAILRVRRRSGMARLKVTPVPFAPDGAK